MGSPPHTRGRLPADEPEVVRGGFTPAYAGKIESAQAGSRPLRVHPRIRGEDRSGSGITVRSGGSPPHTRGRCLPVVLAAPERGFTPAYAGKIGTSIPSASSARVHPRIRGEDKINPAVSAVFVGSPPHTRGRFSRCCGICNIRRFTPAYAGKIEAETDGNVRIWVHPRIRGEDQGIRVRRAVAPGSPPHTRGRYSPGRASGL